MKQVIDKMEKKIATILFLTLFLAANISSEDIPREWDYENKTYYLKLYPEKETEYYRVLTVLEEVRNLIIKNSYRDASEKIKEEIQKIDIETRKLSDLTLLLMLIKIDAAIDYFLLNDKRSGVNKNYIMAYICSRIDTSKILKEKYGIENIVLTENNSILLGAGYGFDTYDTFCWTVSNLGKIPNSELGYLNIDNAYLAARYFFDTSLLSNAGVTLELMYDYLVETLFYMSDYKEDIRLSCGKDNQIRELCIKIINIMGRGIPVIESEYPLTIEIYVTYRKEKAVEFFNKYYCP